jgi:hypothetical protein
MRSLHARCRIRSLNAACRTPNPSSQAVLFTALCHCHAFCKAYKVCQRANMQASALRMPDAQCSVLPSVLHCQTFSSTVSTAAASATAASTAERLDLESLSQDRLDSEFGSVAILRQLDLWDWFYVWLVSVGTRTFRSGKRPLLDRTDRRDLSIFQVDLRFVVRCLSNAFSYNIRPCSYR